MILYSSMFVAFIVAALARITTGGFCRCGHSRSLHAYGGGVGFECTGTHLVADRHESCDCAEFRRDRRRNIFMASVLWITVAVVLAALFGLAREIGRHLI